MNTKLPDENPQLKPEEAIDFVSNMLASTGQNAILRTDRSGNVVMWNECSARIFGYSDTEILGHHISILTPPDRAGEAHTLVRQLFRRQHIEGFETVRMSKDGERINVSLTIYPIKAASGDFRGAWTLVQDITERKRAEEQIHQQNRELQEQYKRVQEVNRLKTQFLANMSHELRTPLNVIMGFTELMHDGKVGAVSPQHKEFLGDILSSSRHLLDLINGVLDLAKIEAGKTEFCPEAVDIQVAISDVCDSLRTMAADKHLDISLDLDPQITVVTIDPSKLKQLLYNYLSNALKFTPDGGRVCVRIRPEGSFFRIEVEDTGIGIKPEDIDRLFVEFQQLDIDMSRKYRGTGLGLALSKHLVEAQGGWVGVDSTPGQGSTFYAVLPQQPVEVGKPWNSR